MDAPPHKVTVLISGTQGEPMSALSRVAVDNHKHVSRGARRHGGAQLAHHSGQREGDLPHDRTTCRGAAPTCVYGIMNPPLHVSGHASVGGADADAEPGAAHATSCPIHGEYRQLAKHAQLAEHLRHVGPRRDLHPGNRRRRWRSTNTARARAAGSRSAASASIPARSTTWWRTW